MRTWIAIAAAVVLSLAALALRRLLAEAPAGAKAEA